MPDATRDAKGPGGLPSRKSNRARLFRNTVRHEGAGRGRGARPAGRGNGLTTSLSNVCSIVETGAPTVKARAAVREKNLWFHRAAKRAVLLRQPEVRIDNGSREGRATPGGVGILAYGSLLTWPGPELHRLIQARVDGVTTPFAVEFARAASRRSGAPTLAPVDTGGRRVGGSLLLLEAGVGLEQARHLLYRREINKAGTRLRYDPDEPPSPDRVRIERLGGFEGCEHVIYARLPAWLAPDPVDLARRAIASARASSGAEGRDGISYLMGVRANGIETPLTPAYEREILSQTATTSLAEAHAAARAHPIT